MGAVAQFLEGMEQKVEYHRQALTLARSMGDVGRQAFALSNLGWDQRNPHLGRKYWEESIVLLRQAGDWRRLAETLGILGFTALSNGELESAQKPLDEAYEINQQINNKEMEFVLTGKGIMALLRGEYGQARAFLETNLEYLEAVGNRMGVLWARARPRVRRLTRRQCGRSASDATDVVENFRKTAIRAVSLLHWIEWRACTW